MDSLQQHGHGEGQCFCQLCCPDWNLLDGEFVPAPVAQPEQVSALDERARALRELLKVTHEPQGQTT